MRADGKQGSDCPWLRITTRQGPGGFWVLVTQVCSFCEHLTRCTLIACALESMQVQHQYKVQGESEASTLVPARPAPPRQAEDGGEELALDLKHGAVAERCKPAGAAPAPRWEAAWKRRCVQGLATKAGSPAPATLFRSRHRAEPGLPIWDEGLG